MSLIIELKYQTSIISQEENMFQKSLNNLYFLKDMFNKYFYFYISRRMQQDLGKQSILINLLTLESQFISLYANNQLTDIFAKQVHIKYQTNSIIRLNYTKSNQSHMPRKKNIKNKRRQNLQPLKVYNANSVLIDMPEHFNVFFKKTCMLCIIYESQSISPAMTKHAETLVKWINHINQAPITRSRNQSIIRQKQKIENDRLLLLFKTFSEEQKLEVKTLNKPIYYFDKSRNKTSNTKINKSFFIDQQVDDDVKKKQRNNQYYKIINFYQKIRQEEKKRQILMVIDDSNETIINQSPIEENTLQIEEKQKKKNIQTVIDDSNEAIINQSPIEESSLENKQKQKKKYIQTVIDDSNQTIINQSSIQQNTSNDSKNIEMSFNQENEIEQEDFLQINSHGSQERKEIEENSQQQQNHEIPKTPNKQKRSQSWSKFQHLMSQKKLKYSKAILQKSQ